MGNARRGEWPPSPARLLAAFIAADGTRDRVTATTGIELETLSVAAPPAIHADVLPCVDEQLHSRINDRFVVAAERKKGAVQEFPGKIATLKRSSVRVAPRYGTVRFVYDLNVTPEELKALCYRAARIGYLGCSDNPVRVSVFDARLDTDERLGVLKPDTRGSLRVNTHRGGDVARWDFLYDQQLRGRPQREHYRGLQHRTRYRLPGVDPEPGKDTGHVAAWLRFDRALSGRQVVLVTHGLKDAVMSQYGQMHGRSLVPDVLHGHRRGQGFDLVRFLALPNVGHQHSDGKIHGAAVWIPPGVETSELARLQRALGAVTWFRMGAVRIGVEDIYNGPTSSRLWATSPLRWGHLSDRPIKEQYWATTFPAVLERYGAVTPTAMNRMCANAGLPPVVSYHESQVPLIPGGIRLAPSETSRPGHTQKRPYSHFVIRFAEPVSGPVVFGAGRSYGLGLCAPVTPDQLLDVGRIR